MFLVRKIPWSGGGILEKILSRSTTFVKIVWRVCKCLIYSNMIYGGNVKYSNIIQGVHCRNSNMMHEGQLTNKNMMDGGLKKIFRTTQGVFLYLDQPYPRHFTVFHRVGIATCDNQF